MHSDKSQQTLNLLKTARGQIDGIIKMIEEDRYCIDISKQILSCQGLLKKANLLVLEGHLQGCVSKAIKENNGKESIQEIIQVLDKYMK